MTDIRPHTDDPRLTAYALGELDEKEHAEVERLLENDPAGRKVVDEILQTGGLLVESLKREPTPALTDQQRAHIETEAAKTPAPAIHKPRRFGRFAAVLLTTTAMAAAAVLVVVYLPNDDAVEKNVSSITPIDSSNTMRPALFGNVKSKLSKASDDGDALRDGGYHYAVKGSNDSSQPVPSKERGVMKPGVMRGGENVSRVIIESSSAETTPNVTLRHWGPNEKGRPALVGDGKSTNLSSPERSKETTIPRAQITGGSRPKITGETQKKYYDFGLFARTSRRRAHTRNGQGRASGRRGPGFGGGDQGGFGPGNRGLKLDGKSGGTIAGLSSPDVFTIDLGVAFKQGSFNVGKGAEKGKAVARKKGDAGDAEGKKDEEYALPSAHYLSDDVNFESYDPIIENDFLLSAVFPLSTFSIDVDTASYANVRRFLSAGQRPPADAVRIEEMINYFHYGDPLPTGAHPFSVKMEVGACPWAPKHRLLRVGIKGKEIPRAKRPPTNLVFLLDVSGSMRDENKLPLVKQAMQMLVNQMTENDRIAIVTYSGDAGLALESTSGEYQDQILTAIDRLNAEGSTNGAAGIQLAYEIALKNFYKKGSNRVILCTDGDFNVGTSDDEALVKLIQQKAKSNVFLSVFGFGMGNLKDAKLEKLADKGNGHYAYVDNRREAEKVFVEDLTGTLYTIAKDVKLQIEFNTDQVGAYRLIGYVNRIMPHEHFNDDTKDAGDIGAGHSVLALYEIVTPEELAKLSQARAAHLKYRKPIAALRPKDGKKKKPREELLTLTLSYKQPDSDKGTLMSFPLTDNESRVSKTSEDFNWAASVAAFGMILRNSKYLGQADFNLVEELAAGSRGDDASGRRGEFINLVKKARTLYGK